MSIHLMHADLTADVVKSFYTTYDELGFGHLEKVYCNALEIEFELNTIPFVREDPLEVFYKRRKAGHYRADFVVGSAVVVEVKATKTVTEDDRRQLLNCLRASKLEVGLLLHYGPSPQIHRLVFANSRKRGLPELVVL
jgi:GxxExxY protein